MGSAAFFAPHLPAIYRLICNLYVRHHGELRDATNTHRTLRTNPLTGSPVAIVLLNRVLTVCVDTREVGSLSIARRVEATPWSSCGWRRQTGAGLLDSSTQRKSTHLEPQSLAYRVYIHRKTTSQQLHSLCYTTQFLAYIISWRTTQRLWSRRYASS